MAEKYPGLLVSDGDKQQALYRSLLDMGANMTRGYTKTPTTPFQSIAEGVAVGGNRYQQEIDRSKKAQIGDINYRMQQAQMEAEKMKIEKAKRQQAEAARKKLITDRFRAQQQYGGFEPGSMDAANYQSGLSPEQQMLNELNPVEQAKSGIASTAALAKEQRVNAQQEKVERIKAGAKAGEKSILSAKDKLELGDKQYNTFVKNNKPNLDRMSGYRSLEAIYEDPSGNSQYKHISKSGEATIDGTVFQASNQGAQDMALIFSVMKMLDPGSTVREGEFALAANSSGQAKAAMNMVKKMWSGDQLPAEARQQLMSLARGQYDAAKVAVDQNLGMAKERMGLRMPSVNPENVYHGVNPEYIPSFKAAAFDPNLMKKNQGPRLPKKTTKKNPLPPLNTLRPLVIG